MWLLTLRSEIESLFETEIVHELYEDWLFQRKVENKEARHAQRVISGEHEAIVEKKRERSRQYHKRKRLDPIYVERRTSRARQRCANSPLARRAYDARYRAKNRTKLREYQKQHYAANRERILAWHKVHRRRLRCGET